MKNQLLIIVLCFVGAGIYGCGAREEGIHPLVGTVTEAVYASGVVRAFDQYAVHPKVTATVKSILVKEGDSIRAGQVLLELDQSLAAAGTSNALLAADFNRKNNNRDKIEEALANVRSAEEKWKTDSTLFERQKRLWSKGIGSKVELENRSLLASNSKNNLVAAHARLDQLQKQLQCADQQSSTSALISGIQQADYNIKSELDGVVYRIFPKQGELVGPATAVAVVGSKGQFYLELQVDEYDIARLQRGQTVFVTMDSYKGQVFMAHLTAIHPFMNERSKSFTVEALFDRSPEVLYPNLTVEANILLSKKENVITIPRSYLINEKFVKLAGGELREIEVGLRDYERVEVTSGLSDTDRIIQP